MSAPAPAGRAKRWYESGKRYFCVPVEALTSGQLSHAEFCVLAALASFVFKEDRVFPSRTTLAARAGVEETNVSRITTKLQALGWLTKTRKGYRRVEYTLHLPTETRTASQKEAPRQQTEIAAPTKPQAPPRTAPMEGLAGPVRRLRPEDQLDLPYLDDESGGWDADSGESDFLGEGDNY
ncbi:MAG: helix-turn-helix domain-containing protein [Burkholderiales bacterium]|nr:helix-turn-helix domain-containing protein [Burkholderiales bacterium]